MSIIHQAPGIPSAGGAGLAAGAGGGFPNEDDFLKMTDGTYESRRVFQAGFSANIQILLKRDGTLQVIPSHTDPVFSPSDEWYEPGLTPNIGFGYEVQLVSTDEPFFVEAAPVGVWTDLGGDVLERRRWMLFRNTQGLTETEAIFRVRTLITHEDQVEALLDLTVELS